MSWPLFRMISGATYSGVPQKVQVFFPNPIFLAKPKSTWGKERFCFSFSQTKLKKNLKSFYNNMVFVCIRSYLFLCIIMVKLEICHYFIKTVFYWCLGMMDSKSWAASCFSAKSYKLVSPWGEKGMVAHKKHIIQLNLNYIFFIW